MGLREMVDEIEVELEREATDQGFEGSGQAGSTDEGDDAGSTENAEELPKCNTCKKEKAIMDFKMRKDGKGRTRTCVACYEKYEKTRIKKAGKQAPEPAEEVLYLAGSIPTLCGYTKQGLDEALEAGTLVPGDVLVKVSIVATFRVKKKISYSIEEV